MANRRTNADGDDNTGTPDDEDGVVISNSFTIAPSGTGRATATIAGSAGTARLYAWIDFNANGSFADAGEQIANGTAHATLGNGTVNIDFAVPAAAAVGTTYARFRAQHRQRPDLRRPRQRRRGRRLQAHRQRPEHRLRRRRLGRRRRRPQDPGDAAGSAIFGYNAFATIQAGINAVAATGEVNVVAGTYPKPSP